MLGALTRDPTDSWSVTVSGAVIVPMPRVAPEPVTETSLPAPPATMDTAVPGIPSTSEMLPLVVLALKFGDINPMEPPETPIEPLAVSVTDWARTLTDPARPSTTLPPVDESATASGAATVVLTVDALKRTMGPVAVTDTS